MVKGGYIYLLTSKNNTVLYTGVTSNLTNRLYQHRTGYFKDSFTSRYKVTKLVCFEEFGNIELAIAQKKQFKAGARPKKIDLINGFNPQWKNISTHS